LKEPAFGDSSNLQSAICNLKSVICPALRLGFRLIKGMPAALGAALAAARGEGRFRSVTDFARRLGVGRPLLARLAAADVFASLGLSRREALWQVLALGEELPLFAGLDDARE